MKMNVLKLLLACFLAFPAAAPAAEAAAPKRIAYYEAGTFWLFKNNYDAIQAALAGQNEFAVVYPPDLHYSPGWDAEPDELDRIAREIQARDDIDLLIAAGTAAVHAVLRTNNGKIPVIGIGLADPLAANIVKSPDDSGVDNFTCEVIVDRWKQMLRVFHDVVRFTKLGIIYPEGPDGLVYSALADAQAVAAELGFEVLDRVMPDEGVEDCEAGLKWLYENGADAFFIGPLTCFDWELGAPVPLMRDLNTVYRIPSFARDGSLYVQGGALMGFATWDFSIAGQRHADQALAIFRGAKPRDLPMRALMEPLIAINLQSTRELGIDLPFDVLIASDEIYAETTIPALP